MTFSGHDWLRIANFLEFRVGLLLAFRDDRREDGSGVLNGVMGAELGVLRRVLSSYEPDLDCFQSAAGPPIR